MSTPIQQVFAKIHHASSVSGGARALTFPQTVAALLALGVTRYHVDYVARMVTTYRSTSASESARTTRSIPKTTTEMNTTGTGTGTSVGVEIEHIPIPPPASSSNAEDHTNHKWSQPSLIQAIRRAQRDEYPRETEYTDFSRACIDAGVVGYMAFLGEKGRRVLYYGADGDLHVEYFPGFEPRAK